MTAKISTSFIPKKLSYARTTTHTEQHSMRRSIILHLMPGILTGAALFLLAPIAQRNGLPALWAHGIADLIIILPFIFGVLYYQGYKKNGRWSLDGIVLYRERIPLRQYLIFVPIVIFSAGIVPLFAPVSNFIFDRLFSWWPAMYSLSYDLRGYSPSIITATFLFNFLMIGLLVPIAEELYFRGYLLPRLSRFGFWAVPIHTALFALFHVWTPWMAVARAIGAIPFALVVRRKQNIYIGMIAHMLFNTLDVVMGVMLILALSK
jgi:membrane protease YdiL (CAAX protease family)